MDPGNLPHDDISLPELGFSTKKVIKLSFYPRDYALALRILGKLKDTVGSYKRRVAWLYVEDGQERLVITKEDDPEKIRKRDEERERKKVKKEKKKSPYERRGA